MLKTNNKKEENGNGKEINVLFEKILARRDKGLKNVESLKRRLTLKLDQEISGLYAKKDFITKIWINRIELRLQKVGVWKKIIKGSFIGNLRYFVSMPFIYAVIVPTIVLHIFVELYHQVCFRLYRIPRVKPGDYFIFDRAQLPYLNWLEKFNCFYCSYFNCLVSYIKEIGGRTEKYWCPIKHSKMLKDQHSNYDIFVDYDDGEELRKKWAELRKFE